MLFVFRNMTKTIKFAKIKQISYDSVFIGSCIGTSGYIMLGGIDYFVFKR